VPGSLVGDVSTVAVQEAIVVATGKHAGDGGGPWLERAVLATPVGEWSTLRLVLTLLWVAGMAGLSASFVYDDLVLDQRGEIVTALVIRANYDQRDPSFNAELQAPFPGVRVLVEGIHQRPHAGDLVELEVDPRKPIMRSLQVLRLLDSDCPEE
jgi:hypothetical protein